MHFEGSVPTRISTEIIQLTNHLPTLFNLSNLLKGCVPLFSSKNERKHPINRIFIILFNLSHFSEGCVPLFSWERKRIGRHLNRGDHCTYRASDTAECECVLSLIHFTVPLRPIRRNGRFLSQRTCEDQSQALNRTEVSWVHRPRRFDESSRRCLPNPPPEPPSHDPPSR